MSMLGSQNLVHDVPVVREEDEAGGILVEPTDRKDPFRMANLRNDVTRHMRLAGRRHTCRLVILDIERSRSPRNYLAISRNDIMRADLISQAGHPLIDGHTAGLDQAIGLSSRTDTVLCEEFIDTKLVGHKMASYFSRLWKSSVYTQYIVGILQVGTDVNMVSGCSKRPSSKAAASEEARRTLRYVEPLNDARTPLAGFFSILLVDATARLDPP